MIGFHNKFKDGDNKKYYSKKQCKILWDHKQMVLITKMILRLHKINNL